MMLKTDRLILRPWKEEDAQQLYEYAKDPNIGPIAGWPVHTDVENSRQIIKDVLSVDETYAVVLKGEDLPIGSIGLMIGQKSNMALESDEGEIGYWIGAPYWGQGLIPEAACELMRHGFEKLGLKVIWCGYFDGNEKSRRAQEKCGFQYHHTEKDIEWHLMNDIRTEHITCITKEQWDNRLGGRLMKEFDSEFCNVKFIEKDKAVLLTWKKFACGDNYRKPTTFAWELLKENLVSNFIIDARNGFEDEKADTEWGFSVLIPGIAQTTCKMVCFLMHEVNEIEEEMDMWTKEFGKYFAVIKASNYENALEKMKRLLMVNVRYHIIKGKRDEFYNKVKEQGIIQLSKEEPGNYKYDYFLPKDSDDDICLMEIWTNEHTQKMHGLTEQYQKLTILKQEYIKCVKIEKYWITEV